LLPLQVSERIPGKGALALSTSIGDPKENADHDLASSSAGKQTKAEKLQEARMELRVHSAAVLAVAAAGGISTVAKGSSSGYFGALEEIENGYPAGRDASKSWGDARLLTSIYLATE
jgi:hypothetical protein